jgi:hypothetical protein
MLYSVRAVLQATRSILGFATVNELSFPHIQTSHFGRQPVPWPLG